MRVQRVKFEKILASLVIVSSLILLHNCSKRKSERAAPRIVNIINFIRLCEPRSERITEIVLYETVVKQVEMMKEYKLRGTFLLQYDALMDQRYQQLLKDLPENDFEIGAWWELPQPLVEKAGMTWRGRYPWDWHANVGFATGYSPKERETLVDVYMTDFKNIFGYYPKSVGSWFIDAHTLNYLYEEYGIVASCNCKDQIGTDGYSLWGGYWNQAYYPSKKNAYMPAQHEENQIPTPVFRMLGSDPIRQYDNGLGTQTQKVVSLEPVYKGGGGDSTWVNWYFDQFVEGECLAFGYVQAGQENSFTWEKMSKGFEIQMPLIARLRDEHKVRVETLAESGQWFREHYKTTPATSVTINQDLDESTLKTVWFNCRFYRSNLLWQDNTLRFRDIHIFDEMLASDYLTKKGASTKCFFYALPFVDGFNWSSVTDTAGLRFKARIDGKECLIRGGQPVIAAQTAEQVKISWPLTVIDGTIVICMDENEIEIKLHGQKAVDWFLEFSACDDAELPFKEISSHRMNCQYKGMDYTATMTTGAFAKGAGDAVFRILPQEDVVSIHFSGKGNSQ